MVMIPHHTHTILRFLFDIDYVGPPIQYTLYFMLVQNVSTYCSPTPIHINSCLNSCYDKSTMNIKYLNLPFPQQHWLSSPPLRKDNSTRSTRTLLKMTTKEPFTLPSYYPPPSTVTYPLSLRLPISINVSHLTFLSVNC